MKFLVLLLVFVAFYVWWRGGRLSQRGDAPRGPATGTPAKPQEMIACSVCTVHLPRGDAVMGGDGRLYCSQEHRLRGDAAPR